ncbi:MAG: hypothetical protein KZQ59_06425, partial [Candidatus Thiodiazotropha sp. (ex Lucinoma aequizonata)]|nr:hypothetical protein [Candidatus Thiodiazotropha sp. (ex Lucinoma aequizonata)]
MFLLPQHRAKTLDVRHHDRQGNVTFEAVYAGVIVKSGVYAFESSDDLINFYHLNTVFEFN